MFLETRSLLRSAESSYDLRCVRYRTCRCSRTYPFEDQLIISDGNLFSVGDTVRVLGREAKLGKAGQSWGFDGGKGAPGFERSRDLDFAKPPLV